MIYWIPYVREKRCMKKIVCAGLICALLMCGCALGEAEVTAEALLEGNSLSACLSGGEYTREYIEYYDAEGNVRDYNDVIYRRGDAGYTMLLTYPEDGGQSVGGMLVGGNYYATISDGVPTYTLYATRTYAQAGSELAIGEGAYIAYPALNEGLELSVNEDGDYVVTASISADKCDQEVVAGHGHDCAPNETVYDEYVYDAQTRALLSERLYYLRGDEQIVCELTTYEYGADGAAYEEYAPAEGARPLRLVINPGQSNSVELSYTIAGDGFVNFLLAEGDGLYSDAECTQPVDAQGAAEAFDQDTYYTLEG